MNRKERRNLQRQGVQVPKDPTLNIKLPALGKSIMTPEMRAAMMHEINQQCLEKDDLLALDADCMVLWTLHQHLGFGVKRLHDFYLAMAAEHRRMKGRKRVPVFHCCAPAASAPPTSCPRSQV